MRQRGFIPLGLLGYGLLALGILGTLAGIGYSIRKAGADAVRAELEPKIAACQTAVEAQNQAIAATKAEGDRRIAAAAKGAAQARRDAQGAISEAERLRTITRTPAPAGSCPAGSAVAEVRKGFRK